MMHDLVQDVQVDGTCMNQTMAAWMHGCEYAKRNMVRHEHMHAAAPMHACWYSLFFPRILSGTSQHDRWSFVTYTCLALTDSICINAGVSNEEFDPGLAFRSLSLVLNTGETAHGFPDRIAIEKLEITLFVPPRKSIWHMFTCVCIGTTHSFTKLQNNIIYI